MKQLREKRQMAMTERKKEKKRKKPDTPVRTINSST